MRVSLDGSSLSAAGKGRWKKPRLFSEQWKHLP